MKKKKSGILVKKNIQFFLNLYFNVYIFLVEFSDLTKYTLKKYLF